MLFSTVVNPFTCPPRVCKDSPFLHILTRPCFSCVGDAGRSDRCEVRAPCGSDLHFPGG